MGKLNYLGIGPKIGLVAIPWLAGAIVLSRSKGAHFAYTSENNDFMLISGIIMMIFGLIFYFSSLRKLLKGLKETRLMTNGAYAICQNPLYFSFLLLIIPALSLIINSWLILTTSVIGYILFKIFIRKEYLELEKFFGEEYHKYKSKTPEFFPFLLKSGTNKS